MRAVEQASAAKQTSEWRSNKYGDNENDYEIMHKAVKNRHAQMLVLEPVFQCNKNLNERELQKIVKEVMVEQIKVLVFSQENVDDVEEDKWMRCHSWKHCSK